MTRTAWLNLFALAAVAVAVALVVIKNVEGNTSSQLLNVSYDPTWELFQDLNQQFVVKYEKDTGEKIIKQSHGGSSCQAKAVIDGLEADVVTLALSSDVDALRKQGLIAEGWATRLPNNSEPYTSTIVFVVRKGNLGDLTRYISESVVIGFMAGAGALVGLTQLGNLLGIRDRGTGQQHVLYRI